MASAHLHFLDFQEFSLKNPVYFNIMRDPANRFISSYLYRRSGATGTPKQSFKRMMKIEPDTYTDGTNVDIWYHTGIIDCVIDRHSVCTFINGTRRDLSIVSFF